MTDTAISKLAPVIGVRAACQAVGSPQASWYRRHRQSPAPQRPAPVPHRDRVQPRALSEAERQAILHELHSERFIDVSPTEVWAILLDEGRYFGSLSTFYRLLRDASGTRERRRQATHPASVKPELVATEPNAVWSWDNRRPARQRRRSRPSATRLRPDHRQPRQTPGSGCPD
jgi:putative transposase